MPIVLVEKEFWLVDVSNDRSGKYSAIFRTAKDLVCRLLVDPIQFLVRLSSTRCTLMEPPRTTAGWSRVTKCWRYVLYHLLKPKTTMPWTCGRVRQGALSDFRRSPNYVNFLNPWEGHVERCTIVSWSEIWTVRTGLRRTVHQQEHQRQLLWAEEFRAYFTWKHSLRSLSHGSIISLVNYRNCHFPLFCFLMHT